MLTMRIILDLIEEEKEHYTDIENETLIAWASDPIFELDASFDRPVELYKSLWEVQSLMDKADCYNSMVKALSFIKSFLK